MDIPAIRAELAQALRAVSRRGLKESCKHLAELLCSACPISDPNYSRIRLPGYIAEGGCAPFFDEADAAQADDEHYLYAKALFDCREFARAAAYLDRTFGDVAEFPALHFFLRCYALYLVRPRRIHVLHLGSLCLTVLLRLI